MKAERAWKTAALALAVWALASGLNTLMSAARYREIIARKEGDLHMIQTEANRWAREDALRAWLDARQAWNPADLDELAVRTLGAGVAKITPRPATPAADGWQRREASIELREGRYLEVALFLAAVAENPPPWRLREIEINPHAEAGKGAMAVVLETVEKKQP